MKNITHDGIDRERAVDEAAWFTVRPVIAKEKREKYKVTTGK
jgi:hypothetical protein